MFPRGPMILSPLAWVPIPSSTSSWSLFPLQTSSVLEGAQTLRSDFPSLSLFSSANFLSFHLWWPCFFAYLDMEIKSFLFPGLPILISWFPMKYYFLFFSRFSSSKWSFIFFSLSLFPTDSTWHFSPCRKLTVTFWWSIKRISQGLLMKPPLSWMI